MTPELAVKWITDEGEFLALREPWNRLAPVTRGRDVFLRHEWFDAAWQWRKEERCGLRIATVYRGARIVGIFPLVLQSTNNGGLPARRLEFLSVPDTQFCDLICDLPESTKVCHAIATTLLDHARDWDLLELKHLSEDAAAMGLSKQRSLRHCLIQDQTPWDANAYIELTESWDAYYGRRSRSLKKANNLAANRLRKAGDLELQWVRATQTNLDQIDSLLEELVSVSARSWKAETGLTLENPRPGAFIRRLTHHALEQNWLSLWCLRLDGKLAAMEYQLVCGEEVFALRADFDRALDTISPGSYLSAHLLQKLFASGHRRYWLGPGQNPYKARWSEHSENLFRVSAYSPSFPGRAHRLNDVLVRPAARKVRAALRRVWRATPDSAGSET